MAEFRRNRGKRAAKAKAVKVLASEVAVTRQNVAALLEMAKDCPDALKGPLTDKELQRMLPTADAIVMAEMTLPNKHDYLMILRTMAQRAMTAMAPRAVWKMAKKIENHLEPGDTRLLVEYLKGLGFFEPAAPTTDTEREEKMARHAKLEKTSLEELKRQLQEDMVA